ncbi:tRNA (adenosine(37)-N6)-threonylcarbamoyltransferase complex ATPase subunit type 1 TsaE [Christiangramia sp. OXR-203]|uniref:tRNA (adenosine(37)-N6)-threonylcarbamoyltransferase complex ATPase subunit type 1 TsaE n=1 Tax=Christiangramia sp. OXR-203 TaxID=3100176 RepID=UPI002AC8C409|nr:tRNA (adenosine(37)-N6)-threonylcarbamoyltransferase complex ATPase subunit type 1 TsaE [Christiangramia sp. OXR-203]WPZ00007.1 tRNA (adenosine(37)-N6)-threonylcarbamoyltransferase complex ATPase subunit type 1 TsaE [Christiangramia sp. OXR-203]
MELTYELHELDQAVDYILRNTKSKTLLFYGEMGAGKTTLIKELSKALGVKDAVSSPTFSLVNHYESDQGAVYHFDFYRIESDIEALDIGFEDYLDSGAWNLIEWPQKVGKLLSDDHQNVHIQVVSENSRMLKLS